MVPCRVQSDPEEIVLFLLRAPFETFHFQTQCRARAIEAQSSTPMGNVLTPMDVCALKWAQYFFSPLISPSQKGHFPVSCPPRLQGVAVAGAPKGTPRVCSSFVVGAPALVRWRLHATEPPGDCFAPGCRCLCYWGNWPSCRIRANRRTPPQSGGLTGAYIRPWAFASTHRRGKPRGLSPPSAALVRAAAVRPGPMAVSLTTLKPVSTQILKSHVPQHSNQESLSK